MKTTYYFKRNLVIDGVSLPIGAEVPDSWPKARIEEHVRKGDLETVMVEEVASAAPEKKAAPKKPATKASKES